MPIYFDQLNREVSFDKIPKRIVSLVPSKTELLYSLGLEDEVVGITKFCVHPVEWFRNKTRIGGTKNIDIEAIKKLQPDLIIANKEENLQEQVEQLEKMAPVWISDVGSITDALKMMESIGELTGRKEKATRIVQNIRKSLAAIKQTRSEPVRTAYLIWKKPYMTVGGDTFIHDTMRTAGMENVFAGKARYPETTLEEIQSRQTKLLLLSSEPYPFTEKHIEKISLQLPGVSVMTVDGQMFGWYGSRMLYLKDYLSSFLTKIRKT